MKIWTIICLLILIIPNVIAAEPNAITIDHTEPGHEEIVDVVVFYGDGCPHCAAEEEFLEKLQEKMPIRTHYFEVYKNETNRELAKTMAERYGETFRGVPMTFIGDEVFIGFSERSITEKESIAESIVRKIDECETECCSSPLEIVDQCKGPQEQKQALTVMGVVALAIADSINPCALAVLAMALIALLAKDPRNKKNVLLGGLAFTLAVFITYLIYGGIIIQFFKFLEVFFKQASAYARIIFATLAIILAGFNLKDYFKYKPGTFGTEMPMFLRPSAKRLIKNITRPRGAFIIGIFVTLFLLPCTIGPYLVVGNLLSTFEFVKSLPWLILYNIIFVLPMIIVTLFVYYGYTTVEKVSGWKEEHIKYLHLGAGVVLLILGLMMLLGYI